MRAPSTPDREALGARCARRQASLTECGGRFYVSRLTVSPDISRSDVIHGAGGHSEVTYRTARSPLVDSSAGGVWIGARRDSSDDIETELDTILAGVGKLLHGPRPRIRGGRTPRLSRITCSSSDQAQVLKMFVQVFDSALTEGGGVPAGEFGDGARLLAGDALDGVGGL